MYGLNLSSTPDLYLTRLDDVESRYVDDIKALLVDDDDDESEYARIETRWLKARCLARLVSHLGFHTVKLDHSPLSEVLAFGFDDYGITVL